MDIKIDPEFRDIIPALTSAEYEQLEKNLIDEGCREKIIVWNEFLIDGHNRYAICQDNDIAFEVLEMNRFENRHEVIDWMIQNQIGKRNLTGGTISYLRGLKLKREKLRNAPEETIAEAAVTPEVQDTTVVQSTEEPSEEVVAKQKAAEQSKQEELKAQQESIAQDVADMYQISPSTLKKDERFTDAIDTIRKNVGRKIQDKILNKELKLNPIEIVSISKLDSDDQKELMRGNDDEILERLAEVKREKQQLNLKKNLIKLDITLDRLNMLPVQGSFITESEEGQVTLIYNHDNGMERIIGTFKGTGKLETYLEGFLTAASLFAMAPEPKVEETVAEENAAALDQEE